MVHIVDSLELGGMERMIQTLCLETMRQGIHASVLCLRRRGVIADELEAEGVNIACLYEAPRRADYLAMLPIARRLRAIRPDVVHTHNTSALLFGATGAWLARVPRIVHTDHGRAFPDRWHRMIGEWVASHWVDYVVGVSSYSVEALRKYERIAVRKLRVIPNGVHAAPTANDVDRARARAEFGVSDDQVLFGLAARLVWEKGLDVLLDAFARTLERNPRARLVIAGDGPERPALDQSVARLGIGGAVVFLGARRDVPRLLSALDVYVLSSVSEGLPMGLLEAMAAGRAIIATDVGGVAEALGNGLAGVVVEAKRIEALAVAMTMLADSPERRIRLGQAARQRFVESYTATAMLAGYLDLYSDAPPIDAQPVESARHHT